MFKLLRRMSVRRSGEMEKTSAAAAHWARVGMRLTFRAEVMPGRTALARTYEVARTLAGGRVELTGLAGQHTETEFEAT